jgi:hypothetical protein
VDDAEYKRLCAAPDVMSRPDLRATEVRLREEHAHLAEVIATILGSRPLPKPSLHDAGGESDFLFLDLSAVDIEAIHDALRDQEALLVEGGEPYPPELSFVVTLASKWNNAESSRSDAG